jgi:hypothetical protein
MPRTARKYQGTASDAYHLLNRGPNRETVFGPPRRASLLANYGTGEGDLRTLQSRLEEPAAQEAPRG